jgi:tight adherence protein B
MGTVVGLLLGSGVFTIWTACWARPAAPRDRIARPLTLPAQVRQELAQAGMPGVHPLVVLGMSLLLAAGGGLVALSITGSPVAATLFAVLGGSAPAGLVRARARRRREELRELWPDVVDNLISAVRAGLSLPEAVSQLADRGPLPLRPHFAAFAAEVSVTGRFGEALDGLTDRIADPAADRICVALRIAREVGGCDLGQVLRSLSAFLREDLRTRSELAARQGWTVNAARLAVGAPWLVLSMLGTRPESLLAYRSPAGGVVLGAGAVISVVAYRVMLRIGRLPQDRRVLGRPARGRTSAA